MGKRQLSGEVAREYCQKYPQLSTKKLAEVMAKKDPLLFNYNKARDYVRYHRGFKVSGTRRFVADPVPFSVEELPKSDAKEWKPLPFPFRGTGLVMSDIHLPYHDTDAVAMAINYALKHGATDFAYLNGDTLDCFQLSDFNKDPRQRNFAGEVACCQKFLETLTKKFKRVLFKAGNHEIRYERFMFQRAPELLDLPGMSLPELLNLEELGVVYVPPNQVVKAAKLTILHGHETGRGFIAPVNPARGMFLRATACTLSGHLHRTSHHNETTIDETLISNWTTGCLCQLHPEYSPINKWDHGFAVLSYDGKSFEVETKRIVKGTVY